jgi:hypothetical protein
MRNGKFNTSKCNWAKQVLGNVAWSHTIFEKKFLSNGSRNKLRLSTNFMILGATDQKLWVFEVFKWSLGRAGMCWRQWKWVDHMCPRKGAGVWKNKSQLHKKRGLRFGQRATATRAPCAVTVVRFFKLFYFFLILFLDFWGTSWHFGRMGVQYPHFLKLAPTFGSVKFSIPHGNWSFHFFSNFIFPKFTVHVDLHIYRWDFCFMKNWGHKNSTRFASIIEIFCTLPQCRVHLSIFHSSSTSKIWHTST